VAAYCLLVIVLYCFFSAYDPKFCSSVLFLKESSASVMKRTRKAKRGGGDLTGRAQNRRVCKDEWGSGLLDFPLFC
jgi:hypothetical protein